MRRLICSAVVTGILMLAPGAISAEIRALPIIAPDAVETMTIKQLEEQSAKGDARAQAELGSRYARGAGVKTDMKKAVALFEQGAKKGDATAQFFLGTAFDMGAGVEKNQVQAARWFQRAAEQNHAGGQYALGVMMTDGQGGLKADPQAAAALVQKSAEQGYYPAAIRMAALYTSGIGVPKDGEKAADWYRRILKTRADTAAASLLATLIETKAAAWQAGDPGSPPGAAQAPSTALEQFGDMKRLRPARQYDRNGPVEVKTFKTDRGMTLESRARDGELALYATSDKPHQCEFRATFTFLNEKGERKPGDHVCFMGNRPAGKSVLLCKVDHPNFDQTQVQGMEITRCAETRAK
ncbi:MAG: tetratricopeptide repeat protein [Rhodospirillaceae bacterium]